MSITMASSDLNGEKIKARLKVTFQVFKHEVQHDADLHGEDTDGSEDVRDSIIKYKSEFRAYWYDGNLNSKSSTSGTGTNGFDNEKQQAIFNHLNQSRGSYRYMGNWDGKGENEFSRAILGYTHPDQEGGNKMNSVRMDKFYRQLKKLSKNSETTNKAYQELLQICIYDNNTKLNYEDVITLKNANPKVQRLVLGKMNQETQTDFYEKVSNEYNVNFSITENEYNKPIKKTFWETIRVSFKPNGNRKLLNALTFEVTDEDINLILEKEKSLYEKYLKSIDTEGDSIKQKAKTEALKLVRKLKWLEEHTEEEKIKEKIEKVVQMIANETIKLQQNISQRISSVPIFGSLTDIGYGTSMTIEILTATAYKGTVGSSPKAGTEEEMQNLNKRRNGDGTYYIRGHLLNHNLGGPGIWENMTPLTRSANKQHSQQIEEKLKEGVDKDQIYRYEVIALYGRKFPSIKKDKKESDNHFKLREDIVKAEQYIPKGIQIKYEELEIVGDKVEIKSGGESKELTIMNKIDQNPSNYYTKENNKTPAIKINNSKLRFTTLVQRLNISEDLAKAIINNKPFGSQQSLYDKVSNDSDKPIPNFSLKTVEEWYSKDLITFTK